MTNGQTPGAAAPFLKWAGGKSALLDQYVPFFPPCAESYIEPFVGSGAVFFHLQGQGFARRYRLYDINAELINVYCMVRDELDALIGLLAAHRDRHSRDYYYLVRGWDRDARLWDAASPVQRAARMIYLNKTCYNGLWRVNNRGQFNVPMGRYRNPAILDAPRLRAASAALQGVEIFPRDFRAVVEAAAPGDFVYFDPPYMPVSQTANFTSYSENTFGEAEQRTLAAVYRALSDRGVRAMLSNSSTPLIHDLYAGFTIKTVAARRMINSNSRRRGAIPEVVVLNY